MQPNQISKAKVNLIRKRFIDGTLILNQIARELNISTCTAWKYNREFQLIQEQYPERLVDMNFYLPKAEKPHRLTQLYSDLMSALPGLIKSHTEGLLQARPLWRKYIELYPNGYNKGCFTQLFYRYIKDNNIGEQTYSIIGTLAPADLETLKKWRTANNRRNWQIAIILEAAAAGTSMKTARQKAEVGQVTVHRWLKQYRAGGLPSLQLKPRVAPPVAIDRIQERNDNLVKLLHETPRLHGLNRTSWTITALTEVYNRIYPTPASYMQLKFSLVQLGYTYKKSRDRLTSPDPHFREKINKIQRILQRLKPNEKFFSIDEYGPVSIKVRGGVTIKHKDEPQDAVLCNGRSKGIVICTAALELSTNQVTHFYSLRKNTFEMLKLIDLLVEQYKNQRTLYLCWDAVSWHNSKILRSYLEELNHKAYRKIHQTPEIKLAPLPSSTQFLNVIESVFAGLARAVIHNSDYASVQECQNAINLHFETRNTYFQEHPKRAGKKIWGKELVAPAFSETQQCKKQSAMRGAR